MITIITTAMWLILFYTTIRRHRKRYDELYTQYLRVRGLFVEERKRQLEKEASRLWQERNSRIEGRESQPKDSAQRTGDWRIEEGEPMTKCIHCGKPTKNHWGECDECAMTEDIIVKVIRHNPKDPSLYITDNIEEAQRVFEERVAAHSKSV